MMKGGLPETCGAVALASPEPVCVLIASRGCSQ
jgi:hypothetical protein